MSYSIFVPFASQNEKEKMAEFMSTHAKHVPTDFLSYVGDTELPILGFNYGAGDEENRHAYFTLCYWMALRAGAKKEEKSYVIYDGYEEWRLFVNEPVQGHGVRVSEHGYSKDFEVERLEAYLEKKSDAFFESLYTEAKRMDEQNKEDLHTLSNRWDEEGTK